MENIKTFFVAFAVFLGIDMVWLTLCSKVLQVPNRAFNG